MAKLKATNLKQSPNNGRIIYYRWGTFNHQNQLAMKGFTAIVLLILAGTTYSQKLKGKLHGDWVCVKILDSKGNMASGKFGGSNEYLRFSFTRGNLSITEAPFDRGLKIPIAYHRDYIDVLPSSFLEIPERKYMVRSLDEERLVLATKNEDGESIEYHFINQAPLLKELTTGERTIDNGLIIVKHFKPSRDSKGTNRASEYRISNHVQNLYPSPTFDDPALGTSAIILL